MIVKVGITGGIGSGKTLVSKIFSVLGVPVYYSDEAAKRLMNEDKELQQALKDHFGDQIFLEGKLDRKALASIVFNDEAQLALLNSIVHPVTIRDSAMWMLQQQAPYALKEAALIFESGAHKELDFVIGITAPEPLRILRVIKRDGISRQEVKARMDKQLDDAIKMRLCDYVIHNDEQQLLIPQVLSIHEAILAKQATK